MIALLGGVVSCFAGCGDGEPVFGFGDPDQDAVANSISVLSDFADRPDRFEPLFVDGEAPDVQARLKYGECSFGVTEPPSISGDKASAQVRVRDVLDKELGVVQWTAVKVGGKWKLKDTPLP